MGIFNLWHTGQLIDKAILQNQYIIIKKIWSVQIFFLSLFHVKGTRLEKNIIWLHSNASSFDGTFHAYICMYLSIYIHIYTKQHWYTKLNGTISKFLRSNYYNSILSFLPTNGWRVQLHSLLDMAASWESVVTILKTYTKHKLEK